MRGVAVAKAFAAARGLAYAGVFVGLWWWILVTVRPVDRLLPLSLPSGVEWLGAALAIIGGVLALWCILSFALVGGGTPAPFDAPREFVAVGPYRYVRNPMCLGAIAVIVGVALVLGSPSALSVAVLFAALAHLFVRLYEEPALERRFGDGYRRYKATVNRWLPHGPDERAPRTAEYWEFAGLPDPERFFRSLPHLSERATTIFLEVGYPDADVEAALRSLAEEGPYLPPRQTLWPKATLYRLGFTAATIEALAALSAERAATEFVDHMSVFAGETEILDYPDAFGRDSRIWVSAAIQEETVGRWAASLGLEIRTDAV